MSTHPKPFWCTVCNHGFAQAFELQLHLQLKHDASPGGARPSHHQSLAPNSTVGDVSNLLVNERLAAAVADMTANAAAAAVSSSTRDTRGGIASGQHGEDNCGICGVFVGKDLLRSHVCSNIKFQLSAAMANHLASERPHICTSCGKGFKTATHLKQHVRCVHSKERPFGCELCGKSFARQSDLNRHIRGVHEKNKHPA